MKGKFDNSLKNEGGNVLPVKVYRVNINERKSV